MSRCVCCGRCSEGYSDWGGQGVEGKNKQKRWRKKWKSSGFEKGKGVIETDKGFMVKRG